MPEQPSLNPEQEKILSETLEAMKGSDVIYSIDFVPLENYRKIFDSLGDLKGKMIIDLAAGFVPIGAGEGSKYFETLGHRGATLIPVEIDAQKAKSWRMLSPDMLSEEERELIATKVEPVRANAFDLPFKTGSIDGALSINFFNLPLAEKKDLVPMLFSELNRVLKDDGFVVLSNFGYFKHTSADGSVVYNNGIAENQIVTVKQLRQQAEESGFQVLDIPLDNEKIKWAQDDLKRQALERNQKIKKVEIVEPTAMFLTKRKTT